jgi:hypothetical protein
MNKITKILDNKRKDINFMSYKILSILLSNYESRLENDPSNKNNIVYKSNKMNMDLYNQLDLNANVRYGAKYVFQGKQYYYNTIVQFLEQLVFGPNTIIIEIMKSNNVNIHKLSVTFNMMEEKYELIKAIVTHIFPIIKSTRIKKNNNKKIILNEEVIIPDTKLEDNSEGLTTVL